MLPELLFSVDSSMQDISRDDFNLLNGECEKDRSAIGQTNSLVSSVTGNLYNTCLPDSPPPNTTSISSNIETANIKLEDSNSNSYNISTSWHNSHQNKFESAKLLLQNSDDPLISRGVVANDDDNRSELQVAVTSNTNNVKVNVQSESSPSIPDTSKHIKNVTPKRNKNPTNISGKPRRKGIFKLRFHHQALPPEYLSHYEMTQNQQNKNTLSTNNNSKTSNENNNNKGHLKNFQITSEKRTNSHETVRNWLEKISQIQTLPSDNQKDVKETDNTNNKDINSSLQSPRKIVKYSDLPYMGEMILENSKPRRGRKPKKADICHLIYKNYGTILPGTPKDKVDEETKNEPRHSLLEKCLSQDVAEIKSDEKIRIEEPLNLCLRDQSGDSFILSSDDENSDDQDNSTRTSPNITQSDQITDSILAANLKMSLPNFQSVLQNSEDTSTPSTGDSEKISPSSCPHWASSDVFLHPVALYYQKMLNACGNTPLSSSSTAATATNTSTNTTTIIKAPNLVKSVQTRKNPSPKTIPKILPQLIKREKSDLSESRSTPSSVKSNNSNTGSTQSQTQPAQKRKRSAIFIPPMPAENTTNPATEVSICKFKFTGGAKPSLQEKKILSVDADGNYRYYSGTGDKSMRGYEFFPRETLQQSGVVPGVNCSEAFLNATGEKIPGEFPSPSSTLSNELLQLPNSLKKDLLCSSSLPNTTSEFHYPHYSLSTSLQASDRRKRKSKRSVQREKLEQTFKEKGFLIQTQQLESAEGATYCKFRQLRKFTRYLFRSWKDYLPDEIQQANAAAIAAAAAAAANQETSPLCDMIEATSGDIEIPSIEKVLRRKNN